MNGSIWLVTAAACLAFAASGPAAETLAPQADPTATVIQGANTCCDEQPRATVGHWFCGTHDCAPPETCNTCAEHAGFFARLCSRLRALFCRSCHDSCCETCATATEPCRPATCADCGDCDQHGPSWRQRLASLFHGHGSEVACCEPQQQMIVQAAPVSAVPVLPVIPSIQASPIRPVSTEPARATMEIAKEYLDKVANADDYSWVTGQLFYIHVHADQGLWGVRYAPVDKEDRYGGSVVLAPAISMADFREGDLVTVHGEVLNQGRASRYLGGPLYRTLAVSLKDRARP